MASNPTRPSRLAMGRASAAGGLTLLEVLLVLAILGVLITIALPTIGGGAGSHRVVRQAREVHAALARARAAAIAEQRPHRFVVVADGRYRLESLSGSGWADYLTSLLPSDPIRVLGGSAGAVVFEPDGRVETPATVQVGEPPRRHELRVLAGGMVEWKGPSS